MTQKKLYITLFAALILVISSVAGIMAHRISSSSAAKPLLEKETSQLAADTEKLMSDTDELRKEMGEVLAGLEEKDSVNSQYMEHKKKHDELAAEVSEFENRLSELNAETEAVQKELDTSTVTENKTGKRYSLAANETYSCPDKIPENRYVAKGTGTLTVLTSSGQTRISQNLDVAYNSSYTFNLSRGERLHVTGNVTLTELK